jgi:hypothetical protein
MFVTNIFYLLLTARLFVTHQYHTSVSVIIKRNSGTGHKKDNTRNGRYGLVGDIASKNATLI